MTAATASAPVPKATPKPKTERVKAKIQEQVIALLGKPDDLYRIDVHFYTAGRARINIWRREPVRARKKGGFFEPKPDLIETTHITDSFYLHLDKAATIKTTSPAIKRRY